MTDKEKRIEEMAKEIWRSEILCNTCGESTYTYCGEAIAELLYNAGYRKIPEGSVVLSRQEWEKYQITQRDYNATYFDGIYQARKETASAFVQEFENGIDALDTIINEENLENYVSVNEVLDFVDKIAKQFGVEVEE